MDYMVWVTIAFVFFAGTVVLGLMMLRMASMIRKADGKKVSLVSASLKKPAAFKSFVSSLPSKSLQAFREWIRLDYKFMLFVYPLMSLVVVLIDLCERFSSSRSFFLAMILLPAFTWLMDLLENIYIGFSLDKEEDHANSVYPMIMFSALKWLGLLLWIAGLVYWVTM
jgi:hypothetical protein